MSIKTVSKTVSKTSSKVEAAVAPVAGRKARTLKEAAVAPVAKLSRLEIRAKREAYIMKILEKNFLVAAKKSAKEITRLSMGE